MTFTESSTVESLVRDLLCGGVTHHTAAGPGLARRGGQISGLGWHYLAAAHVPRQPHDVLLADRRYGPLTRTASPSSAFFTILVEFFIDIHQERRPC